MPAGRLGQPWRLPLRLIALCLPLAACRCDPEARPPTAELPATALSWQAEGGAAGAARSFLARSDGDLLAEIDGGLVHWTEGEGWRTLPAEGLPEGPITGLFDLGEDGVLIWVHGKGGYLADGAGGPATALAAPPVQPLMQTLLNPRGVVVPMDVARGPDGRLWMAAIGGLFASDDGGQSWLTVDLSGTGAFNVLFTAVAVEGDRVQALSQRADSLLPSAYQGLLGGTLFASDDGGQHWQERGQDLDLRYPTDLLLDPAGADCLASLDRGLLCLQGGDWVEQGGPSDPIALARVGDRLLAASASTGPWLLDGEGWSKIADGGPLLGLGPGAALDVDGQLYRLLEGEPEAAETADGTVHVALSFHVNLYHSYRGDTPDEDGYGKDIRVIRRALDWLDAHPEVHADWDIENHFSLDGWLASEAPDIVERIAARVASGQDDVRIMAWNNGAMADSSPEEFAASVQRAQASGLAAFGRLVPGVQPQECMFTADHIGWYRDLEVDWVTLFYSATGFTGPRLDVDLRGAEAFNPVEIRDPADGATMTWVPAWHHADVLDHGGLRGWARQLNQSIDGDSLLLIHFDADGETWEHFDQEIDAVEDLVASGSLSWTTIQSYLDRHPPLARHDWVGDVADGTGDGFQSWAEKDFNHALATRIFNAREAAERADYLAEGDLGVAALLDAALTPRLLALSTTHFGLAAPYLAEDRVASANAFAAEASLMAGEAQDAALALHLDAQPLLPGELRVLNSRPSAGVALVEGDLVVPQARWLGEDGLAIFDEAGTELPLSLGPLRGTGSDWRCPSASACPWKRWRPAVFGGFSTQRGPAPRGVWHPVSSTACPSPPTWACPPPPAPEARPWPPCGPPAPRPWPPAAPAPCKAPSWPCPSATPRCGWRWTAASLLA